MSRKNLILLFLLFCPVRSGNSEYISLCEKYKNSALYHGAILWNMLPVNIRNIDSFDSFKAH